MKKLLHRILDRIAEFCLDHAEYVMYQGPTFKVKSLPRKRYEQSWRRRSREHEDTSKRRERAIKAFHMAGVEHGV
jgi:hypothetical protein